eukprot:TRINITY_DN11617_c0_g1_i1.p1 TRINITY_DN11617_c0_g1~~TRINITY_DN11617_c0_g1_i1.p1  ORF type:complete len:419 (+),score=129.98 TRINITY_DN11617_c0_g1_i1:37-1293(+)
MAAWDPSAADRWLRPRVARVADLSHLPSAAPVGGDAAAAPLAALQHCGDWEAEWAKPFSKVTRRHPQRRHCVLEAGVETAGARVLRLLGALPVGGGVYSPQGLVSAVAFGVGWGAGAVAVGMAEEVMAAPERYGGLLPPEQTPAECAKALLSGRGWPGVELLPVAAEAVRATIVLATQDGEVAVYAPSASDAEDAAAPARVVYLATAGTELRVVPMVPEEVSFDAAEAAFDDLLAEVPAAHPPAARLLADIEAREAAFAARSPWAEEWAAAPAALSRWFLGAGAEAGEPQPLWAEPFPFYKPPTVQPPRPYASPPHAVVVEEAPVFGTVQLRSPGAFAIHNWVDAPSLQVTVTVPPAHREWLDEAVLWGAAVQDGPDGWSKATVLPPGRSLPVPEPPCGAAVAYACAIAAPGTQPHAP